MSDVDGLLERMRCIAACESCKRGVGRAMNSKDVIDIIATIEQQRAEIERLRSQLSPRCSVPEDIDLDVNGGDDADNPMGNQWDEWSELHDSD